MSNIVAIHCVFNQDKVQMKHMMVYAVAATMGVLLLTGCLQGGSGSGSEPTTPETYQYKGRKDPFLATPAADRAKTMAERFNLIQGRV